MEERRNERWTGHEKLGKKTKGILKMEKGIQFSIQYLQQYHTTIITSMRIQVVDETAKAITVRPTSLVCETTKESRKN